MSKHCLKKSWREIRRLSTAANYAWVAILQQFCDNWQMLRKILTMKLEIGHFWRVLDSLLWNPAGIQQIKTKLSVFESKYKQIISRFFPSTFLKTVLKLNTSPTSHKTKEDNFWRIFCWVGFYIFNPKGHFFFQSKAHHVLSSNLLRTNYFFKSNPGMTRMTSLS